ncbi:MAG: Do family serine endopeptidase [Odoribacter sp.]
MKIAKLILPFIWGLAGGAIAFWMAETFSPKTDKTAFPHEIVGPGSVRSVANQSDGDRVNGVAGSIDLREAAKKTVPAVVNVKTIQMGREYVGNPFDFWFGGIQPQMREVPQNMGIGSGVIISEDGYIITNNHVIDRSDKIVVTLNDKREFEAKIIGADRNTDIALLKIEASDLQPIEYGNSDDVVLGEWVLAVGNPYNLNSTVTAGIISAKARELGGRMNLESFLQTDAAVNPGNSGGALVNAKGELIGINTAIQSPTGSYSGYSFAVPVNVARKIVGDLKEYGKVQKAVIGIRMRELTPAVAQELKLKEQAGIYIAEVIQGGAAAKAGLKEEDIIISINGIETKTYPEFQEQLAKYTPGNTVKFGVIHGGKERTVDVLLQNSYGDMEVESDFGILGAEVVPLTQQDRYRFRLNKGVKIKALKNGKFKSSGLSEGYIIVKINDASIYDSEDLERAIKAAGDEGVFVTAVSPRGRVEYFAFSLLN